MWVYEKRGFRRLPLGPNRVFAVKNEPEIHTHLENFSFYVEKHVNSRLKYNFKHQKTLKSSEKEKCVCVFGYLCVFSTRVLRRNRDTHKMKNPYTPTFRGVDMMLNSCFMQAWIWENRRKHEAKSALLGNLGASSHALCKPEFGKINANTGQIFHI